MILNRFEIAKEIVTRLHPDLWKFWPIPYQAAMQLKGWGKPSRVVKYNDYCAVHYTHLFPTGVMSCTITDAVAFLFPGEFKFEAFRAAEEVVENYSASALDTANSFEFSEDQYGQMSAVRFQQVAVRKTHGWKRLKYDPASGTLFEHHRLPCPRVPTIEPEDLKSRTFTSARWPNE